MNKHLGIKTGIILATLALFLAGIFLGGPSNWAANWKLIRQKGLMAGLQNSIHLGLDLRGGTHLILQVQVQEAVAAETDRAVERLKEELRGKNVAFTEIARSPEQVDHILVKGVSPNQISDVRQQVTESYVAYDLSTGPEGELVLSMKPQALDQLKRATLVRSIETIRGRVDSLGVTEPVIQEHGLGENQILVQLPGVDDPARVRQIMQETGMLEIRQVFGGPYASEEAAREANGGFIPSNQELLPDGTAQRTGQGGYFLVGRSAVVAGEDIRSATPARSDFGAQKVDFTLTAAAGKRFEAFTSANIGNSLGVVLNRRVRSVATIRDRISDRGQIEGLSAEEAKDLSKLLESGALPASIKYLEDRTVGASLGSESIRQGVTAGLIGLALVAVFMLIYYKGAGINANLGLFLNLVILLGFLGFSGATLTLPGIAGVILTIGMGVDSNVLIFERIREELRHGKAISAAVEQGFARAWLTIVDTHLTVVVSALILFLFGSGPVRGFAVTLSFGLAANLFTAVFVSRVIFDAILQRKQRGEPLSI
jgi:preprotein translocase subunit SecD